MCTPQLGREEPTSAVTSGGDEAASVFSVVQLCSSGYQASLRTEPWAVPLALLTWNNRTGSQLPQHRSDATFHVPDSVMDVYTV